MACAALGDNARAWDLMALINPIRHASTSTAIQTYKVEPYVVAADVYSNGQHIGRGGWTWYTGSAGWMYRLLAESLLGLRLEVDHLRLQPVCRTLEVTQNPLSLPRNGLSHFHPEKWRGHKWRERRQPSFSRRQRATR